MEIQKVGILSFSNGRKRVHDSLSDYITECEKRIKEELEKTSEVKVYTLNEIIFNMEYMVTM